MMFVFFRKLHKPICVHRVCRVNYYLFQPQIWFVPIHFYLSLCRFNRPIQPSHAVDVVPIASANPEKVPKILVIEDHYSSQFPHLYNIVEPAFVTITICGIGSCETTVCSGLLQVYSTAKNKFAVSPI